MSEQEKEGWKEQVPQQNISVKSSSRFFIEKIDKGFIKHNEWPPASPNCNPLHYYFWDKIKIKFYGDRCNQALEKEKALKKKIEKTWSEVSNDLTEIHNALKQFFPSLTSVQGKDGQYIKMSFADL